MHNAGIELRSLRARADRHSSQLSHADIYCHIIKGLMMTSDGLRAAARQIRLFVIPLSRHWLCLPPPPPVIINHHPRRQPDDVRSPGELHTPPFLSSLAECHQTYRMRPPRHHG